MRTKLIIVLALLFIAFPNAKADRSDSTLIIFHKIIQKSQAVKADTLAMGNLMIFVALNFEGTPYVGGTLEKKGFEITIADFTGLDCVTFTENVLALARCIKKHKTDYYDFIKELTLIRYRNGKVTDYSSRLHYSSEWIYDGINKKLFTDIGLAMNAVPVKFNCCFMSKNPQYYPDVLKKSEKMQQLIAKNEQFICDKTFYYIPKEKIAEVENTLDDGDIVLITSNKLGLDYNHLGILFTDPTGKKVLLHASSKMKKVIMSGELSQYIQSGAANTGISVMKPIAP